MNLGIRVLQCQVPTWLGQFEEVKINYPLTWVYANNQQKTI